MATIKFHYLVLLGINFLYSLLICIYFQERDGKGTEVYEMLGLDETPQILLPESLSSIYLVHFFVICAIFQLCIALASLSINSAKRAINDLAKTQMDRLYEIQGLEDRPYIVAKSVCRDGIDKLQNLRRNSHKTSLSCQQMIYQEQGFTLAFISQEFERQFLNTEFE